VVRPTIKHLFAGVAAAGYLALRLRTGRDHLERNRSTVVTDPEGNTIQLAEVPG
jgi:hypothetical protein